MAESRVIDANVNTVVDNDSPTDFHVMCIYDGVIVNNAPTFDSPIDINVDADSIYTFDPAAILAAMTDIEGDSLNQVKVIESVDKGLLTYGDPTIATVINGDVLSWANFANLRWAPIAGQSGFNYTTLTLRFRDDGENPKCWSDDVVIIFHVLGENYEPTVDDHTVEMDHGDTITLPAAFFTQNYYDPELDPLGWVIIHNLPSGNVGNLIFQSTAVTWADMPLTVTAAQLANGDLEYADGGVITGAKTININFTVYDNVP